MAMPDVWKGCPCGSKELVSKGDRGRNGMKKKTRKKNAQRRIDHAIRRIVKPLVRMCCERKYGWKVPNRGNLSHLYDRMCLRIAIIGPQDGYEPMDFEWFVGFLAWFIELEVVEWIFEGEREYDYDLVEEKERQREQFRGMSRKFCEAHRTSVVDLLFEIDLLVKGKQYGKV
jgi:hypothetical protein